MPTFIKNSIIAFTLIAILFSCQSSRNNEVEHDSGRVEAQVDVDKYAQLEFVDDFFDFGTVKQGEVVSYTFKITNTGNAPLIIQDIVPECGCTKSKLSSNVVKPNEVITFEVVFDSAGWRGLQYKSVTVRTNGKIKNKSVTIKANVVT